MNKEYVKTENLRLERIRQRKTYKEMADLLGFKSPGTYYNIEKGKTIPRVDTMFKISKILEQPIEYFFNP